MYIICVYINIYILFSHNLAGLGLWREIFLQVQTDSAMDSGEKWQRLKNRGLLQMKNTLLRGNYPCRPSRSSMIIFFSNSLICNCFLTNGECFSSVLVSYNPSRETVGTPCFCSWTVHFGWANQQPGWPFSLLNDEQRVFTHLQLRYTLSVSPGSNKEPKAKKKVLQRRRGACFWAKRRAPVVFLVIYIVYIYNILGTLNDRCFGWKRPCFEELTSRCIHICKIALQKYCHNNHGDLKI